MILNISVIIWLLIAITWTKQIISDSSEKIKYFGKEFVSQLRDVNLTLMANTIQSSKITVIWLKWVDMMEGFYKNLKWSQYYVVFTTILFGIFHTSSILIPISSGIIVGSTILSLFLIKNQQNIIHDTGRIINTLINNCYLLKRDPDAMTDIQKQDLQSSIDIIYHHFDMLNSHSKLTK